MPPDALWLSSAGLRIGRRLVHGSEGRDEASSRRLEAVLAFAFGRRLTLRDHASIEAARALARGGDLAAANIRLALAKLHRVPAAGTIGHRLSLVEQGLNAGRSTADLLQTGEASDVLTKEIDSTEPRVPAHSGEHGGEWTRAGGATSEGSGGTDQTATAAVISPSPRSSEHSNLDDVTEDVQYRGVYHDFFVKYSLK